MLYCVTDALVLRELNYWAYIVFDVAFQYVHFQAELIPGSGVKKNILFTLVFISK